MIFKFHIVKFKEKYLLVKVLHEQRIFKKLEKKQVSPCH